MDRGEYVQFYLKTFLEKESVRLGERLSQLVQENHMKGGSPYGFLLGGSFHTIYNLKGIKGVTKALIHEDLREEGVEYLQAKKDFETDAQRIKQGLSAILFYCKDDQDVRDLLTEPLAKQHPQLSQLPRTREPGWVFEGKPFQQNLFKQTIDILEFHYSNLIF